MIYQDYKKTVLENGLTVVSEYIPSVRSVSLGVWVRAGTRLESPDKNGLAHFLEHMIFKGTKRRSPREIVRSIESRGGQINAFTSKEQCCYHAEVLDEDLPLAVDVLGDLVSNPLFPGSEIEKERQVILDEIDSLEDSPEELIHDHFAEALFPDHRLGMPVLGVRATVSSLERADLLHFYDSFYHAGNLVVAAAGNLDHTRLIELVQESLPVQPCKKFPGMDMPTQFNAGRISVEKPIQQAHICMGAPGLPYAAPQKYQLLVLNTLLGGGMGSRLFQNIREAHGIAYGIYSYLDFYFDSGLFGVYLGTDARNIDRAIELVEQEFRSLREEPIPEREILEAKSQLKGNFVLGLESTVSRMNRLGMQEIYFGDVYSIDTIIQRIDGVTRESLKAVIDQLLQPERFLTLVFQPHR